MKININLSGVVVPRREKPLVRFLTKEQVCHILRSGKKMADENPSYKFLKTAIEMLYHLGMRVSEVVNLRHEAINFSAKTVRVFGKGGKERVLPLNQSIFTNLQELMLYRSTIIPKKDPKFLLFKNDFKPLDRHGISKFLKTCAQKTPGNVPAKLTPHILRHSIASHLLEAGASLPMIQAFLGHSDIGTVQIYTHIQTSRLRTIYNSSILGQ